METLQFHKIHIYLFLLFLFQFSWLQFLSTAYQTQDKYFINCGSDSNVKENGTDRDFVGESDPQNFSFTKHGSRQVSSQSSVPSSLYQTARIFQRESSYKFNIDSGTYMVRLHFFAFASSSINLSAARFNVSASGFWLLNNFSAKNYSDSGLIKEFILGINGSRFQIRFTPLESSFAFVNAIELFLLPQNFTQNKAPRVSPKGNGSDYGNMTSRMLQTSYRLNVGGDNVTLDYPLWRSWDTDYPYLDRPEVTENYSKSTRPKFALAGQDSNFVDNSITATEDIGPELMYQSARGLNEDLIDSNVFNITWGLDVKKNVSYLVRVHFCDIISQAAALIKFNLYIYKNFIKLFDASEQNVPFYFDFVVDSDDSGLMSISIGSRQDSTVHNAFLNGLEVMEIIDQTGPVQSEESNEENHLLLQVGSAVGALFVVGILVVGFFLHKKATKRKSPVPHFNLGLKIPLVEIQFATNNFDTNRIIGRGGFGNVYKGVLKNGMEVAVKRGQVGGSGQGLPEFETEIMILSKIHHRHLVSLIGYCDERSEMILVYEYMKNGILRDHLYNSNLPSLSWTQRLEICIGAARGLHYLHKESTGGIIHRDIKSTNILLDENLVAKVADFGLSRTGPIDHEPFVITGVKGTFGYLDPEYFRFEQLTEKSDVYSFGVVLLEVLCARPAIDTTLPTKEVNLAEWGIHCKNKGVLEDIIDPIVKGKINPNSLRKFGETVEKCLQEDGSDRPTMGQVLWDLEYALQLQLQEGARPLEEGSDSSSGASASASIQFSNVRLLPSLSTLAETDVSIMKDDEADGAGRLVISSVENC